MKIIKMFSIFLKANRLIDKMLSERQFKCEDQLERLVDWFKLKKCEC